MKRFQSLLTEIPGPTPKDEQVHASSCLAGRIEDSNLRLWKKWASLPPHGKALLLVVAPYSQYDLVLLDIIDENAECIQRSSIPVFVANLLDYENSDQVNEDIPGIGQVHQSPLAAVWENGVLRRFASGKQARDLAAEVLDIPPDDLLRRIVAEVPKYKPIAT